jgi:AcrR family transcriptional regulator
MQSKRTQAERSATTRSALLTAARPLFAQRGYADVGTPELAAAAGVTRGALYHQFADKAELFAAVFEEVEAELTATLGRQVAEAGATDPLVALRVGAAAWLDASADPEVQRIVLLDAPSVLGWERFREVGMRHGLGLVEAVLGAAMEAGAIAPQPLRPLAHILIGAVDEAALYVARAEDPVAARAEVGAVLAALIEGLARGSA